MKTRLLTLYALYLLLSGTTGVLAADKRISPRETVRAEVNGCEITVSYGRPYTRHPVTGKVRKIWGGLVPYNKIWKMGADNATVFKTSKTLEVGDSVIPAGAYSLFMLPLEKGTSKLAINKLPEQMGTSYKEDYDIAHLDLKKDDLEESVDRFTIAIDKDPAGGGILKFSWEKTQFSLAFKVKE